MFVSFGVLLTDSCAAALTIEESTTAAPVLARSQNCDMANPPTALTASRRRYAAVSMSLQRKPRAFHQDHGRSSLLFAACWRRVRVRRFRRRIGPVLGNRRPHIGCPVRRRAFGRIACGVPLSGRFGFVTYCRDACCHRYHRDSKCRHFNKAQPFHRSLIPAAVFSARAPL